MSKILKVQKDFLRADIRDQDKVTYPIMSASNVKESFAMNQSWTLSFDVFDDGSNAFKSIDEECIIWCDGQPFAIQSITYKYSGRKSISVSANHYINSEFKRVIQPKQLYYKDTADDNSNSATANKFYCDLRYLINWFFDGVETQHISVNPDKDIQGYFPVRPIKGISPTDQKVDGQKLLSAIKSTWPGTRIIPNVFSIKFQGYGEHRDKNGNLINIGNIKTGQRFDTLSDITSSEVSYDRGNLCNAVEVKFAMHQIHQESNKNENDDDDDDDSSSSTGNQYVFKSVPYHSPILVTSKSSTDKYGIYLKTSVLDDSFTNVDAAIGAAREAMVIEPTLKIKATVNTPGQTQERPVPGSLYTYGVTQEGKLFREVMMMSYTRYPYDSRAGMEIELDEATPSITESIRTIIIHDIATDPELTDFQKTDPEKPQELKAPEMENSDDTDDRADDDGSGSDDTDGGSDKGKKGKNDGTGDTVQPFSDPYALPVYDKLGYDDYKGIDKDGNKGETNYNSPGPQAFISNRGDMLLNQDKDYLFLRQGSSDQLSGLINDNWASPEDYVAGDEGKNNDHEFQHVAGFEIGKYGIHSLTAGHGKHHENGENHSFWKPAGLIVGGTMISSTGLIVTQGNQIVFRSHAAQQDLDSRGFYKRHTEKSKDGKTVYTDDITPSGWENDGDLDNVNWTHVDNPGVLATLHFHQAGSVDHPVKAIFSRFLGSNNRWVDSACIKTINVKNLNKTSLLSEKENVKPLNRRHALKTILSSLILNYNYKGDDETHSSIAIDDVHKKPQTRAPKEWISKDGKGRKDDVTVGYLVAGFQELYSEIREKNQEQDKKIKEQEDEIKALKAEVNDLKNLISKKLND